MSTPVSEILCAHCGRHIIPADSGHGWRHETGLFVSCHPGRLDTLLAEPEPEDAA